MAESIETPKEYLDGVVCITGYHKDSGDVFCKRVYNVLKQRPNTKHLMWRLSKRSERYNMVGPSINWCEDFFNMLDSICEIHNNTNGISAVMFQVERNTWIPGINKMFLKDKYITRYQEDSRCQYGS